MSKDQHLKLAQRLITKGKENNDSEMVALGEKLIKKHSLLEEVREKEAFIAPTRKPGARPVVLDEDGNEKKIARTEQINTDNIHNEWADDGQEFHDKANEVLQQTARYSIRTRAPYKPITVTCECGNTEQINPALKTRVYKCPTCIRRLGRR
jgi:hypothetical protein